MENDLWRRAEEIFHAALKQPREFRPAFLNKACGENTELQRLVERLISTDEQAGSFLEKPALAGATVEGFHMIKKLGHYQVTNQIGKGGMGEVYLAKDSKLGRDVAIKVLPEQFAQDADRVARFQREAKVLASLNHPNIAAIYGLEESGGTNFLILELVEGDTLADRLKGGKIPVGESLKLALQIAEALEAAHEKGVIHRDLKPANIKVTPDGKVKVLDFGLAKAFAGEQADLNLSNSPTLSNMATQQGVILGTAAYMAPEQARGKAVDKRADIWAFGCILYEMLTGDVAFRGEDVSEILASVIKGDVKLDLLPANLHPRIREAIIRCLQKDLKRRYSSIADARYEIEQALADPNGVLVQPVATPEPQARLRTILPWAVAAIIAGALIAAVAAWNLLLPEPRQVVRFDDELPEGQQFSNLQYSSLAVSPDGRQIVYCTSKGLYLRSIDELNAKPIAGTEDAARQPFFSFDGKWIGYQSYSAKLKTIPVNGGAPNILSDDVQHRGLWWNKDDTILYGREAGDIMRISIHGGTPESIIKRKLGSLLNPQLLPDKKSILYTFCAPKGGECKVLVQSIESGEPKELLSGFDARYIPPGFIIYRLQDDNRLFAVPFDLSKLEKTGVPVSIVDNVIQYAVSDSGTLAYIPGTSAQAPLRRTMFWVSRDGKEESIPVPPDSYSYPRISPKGKRVAFTLRGNIYILDLETNNMTRLTVDEGMTNMISIWTPDGKRIIYTASHESVFSSGDIYWKSANGTGEAEMLASYPGRGLFPWSISQDGKNLLLLETILAPLENDIGMISMDGGRARKPLLQKKGYLQKDPQISPNGKWLAYKHKAEGGKFEIYVRSFPDMKSVYPVSTGGGNTPLWSPDGRELFYYAGDAVMAVPVETETTFSFGRPVVLFRGTCSNAFGDMIFWDIDPSTGKRFLMMKEEESAVRAAATAAPRKINIVLNWTEELKRLVPAK
jgi:serine/threonine protein kinase